MIRLYYLVNGSVTHTTGGIKMKFIIKALIILAVILLILAIGDSLFNGLFSKDGYRPVTQQMKEVMTGYTE